MDERLAVARACGAVWTGNPRRENVVAAIQHLEPLGLDAVFECAGEQDALDQGVELLKPGGALLVIGIPEVDRISFNISLMRRNELRILNVRRQNECVEPAIELIASGRVERPATGHAPFSIGRNRPRLRTRQRAERRRGESHHPHLMKNPGIERFVEFPNAKRAKRCAACCICPPPRRRTRTRGGVVSWIYRAIAWNRIGCS